MNPSVQSFQFVSDIFATIARIPSFGLIILLVAVFAEGVLAFAVLRGNFRSATNIIFFLLSFATIGWLIVGYLGYLPQFYPFTVLLARFGIFFAAPMSSLFFLLAHTLPSPKLRLKPILFWLTVAGTILMMALNISPYAFSDATNVVNGAVHPVPSAGLAPFAVLSTLFSVFAVYLLIRKSIRSSGEEQSQTRIVLEGMLIMLGLIIGTVLIPILLFNSGTFLIITPIYTLIFLGMTAYAIVKYGLFNVKVIATEALTIVIWITLFSNIFVLQSSGELAVGILVFIATVILGIVLIRSVRAEVRQREELQRLSEKLEELSRFKSQLLSLASHQMRSPLAAMKGLISLVVGGSYGPVDDKAKETLAKVQRSADELIGLINTLLDVRKVEEGKMEYQFAKIDLNKLAGDVVEMLRPLALAKKLEFTFTSAGKEVPVNADLEKFKQVIQNLTDNAIKYTPEGFVRVELKVEPSTSPGQAAIATVSVSDSGLGFPETLKPYLFEEFIRDERVKKEIRGTGLGLYIARKIAEAHGGSIGAESAGPGKGSAFHVSIPIFDPAAART